MPSPARRTNGTATVAPATATNCTLTKPSGVTNGDVMIAVMYIETVSSVTAPSGWALVAGTNPIVQNGSSPTYRHFVWWKRASSEGASWQWTHSSAFRGMMLTTYSGCVSTGTPTDPAGGQSTTTGNNTGGSSVTVFTSITTSFDANMLVAAFLDLNGNTVTVGPSGGLSQVVSYGNGGYVYDLAQATAGATGNFTATLSSNDFWSGSLIALDSQQGSAVLMPIAAYCINTNKNFGLAGGKL